ncbi:MAG: LamG domain-containing protein, partial [Planctomycetota bacterium]
MRHSSNLSLLSRGVSLSILLSACFLSVSLSAQGLNFPERGPISRASAYDGASRVVHADRPAFRPTGAVTIEAWVYRIDSTRCETVVSKGFADSWWLGFCPRPRLYTSNRESVDADRNIPSQRWCHLAVTVTTQGVVTFYIDYEPAGGGVLSPIASAARPLVIGEDAVGGFSFHGAIDELRIWNVARTDEEIRSTAIIPLESRPGLLAVFPEGGRRELVSGTRGTATGEVEESPFGVVPVDLLATPLPIPSVFDGVISEYEDTEEIPLRFKDPFALYDGVLNLGFDENFLYLGGGRLWLGTAQQRSPGVAFLIDPDDRDEGGEYAILLDLRTGVSDVARYENGQLVDCDNLNDCPPKELFAAALGSNCVREGACAEFRVSRSLLDEEHTRVAVVSYNLSDEDSRVFTAPFTADTNDPSTWAPLLFLDPGDPTGSGTCADPWVLRRAVTVLDLSGATDLGTSAGVERCLDTVPVGPDAVLQFTADRSGPHHVVVRSPEGRDLSLVAVTGSDCPEAAKSCIGASNRQVGGLPEVLEIDLVEGETYTLIVSGPVKANDGLGEVEVRILPVRNLGDLVATVYTPDEAGYELAKSQMEDVWEDNPAQRALTGIIARGQAVGLSAAGFGVNHHAPQVTIDEPR